jgi:hypothetical protein
MTTYTITSVQDAFNDWNGPKGTVRYFTFQFQDSNGGVGTGSFGRAFRDGQPPQPPAVGFTFVAGESSFDERGNVTKFKNVKTPEAAAQYGFQSGSAGESANRQSDGDKMRSKEQCMRGEAVIAASNLSGTVEGTLSIAAQIAAWIAVGGTVVPSSSPAMDALAPAPAEIPF